MPVSSRDSHVSHTPDTVFDQLAGASLPSPPLPLRRICSCTRQRTHLQLLCGRCCLVLACGLCVYVQGRVLCSTATPFSLLLPLILLSLPHASRCTLSYCHFQGEGKEPATRWRAHMHKGAVLLTLLLPSLSASLCSALQHACMDATYMPHTWLQVYGQANGSCVWQESWSTLA